MKRWLYRSGILFTALVLAVCVSIFSQGGQRQDRPVVPGAGQPGPNQDVPIINDVPLIPFESVPNFFKTNPDMNFGETLAVAVNSKGNIVVINHPGTATSGPLYGNATTQLWEFDSNGKFLREIGKGVYGLGYAHGVRFDKYDNLWVVDKGTNSIMKFNPAGYVVMNLGRRPEGYEGFEFRRARPPDKVAVDGLFDGPTDVAWDAQDNIYISDGYVNSRIGKMNKNGDWIKSWGSYGTGSGQFRNPHNMQIDRQGNVYVADRGNGRIQVFDSDGNFKKFIWLNVAYDKKRHPTLGNANPNPPNASAPWALCITTNGPMQYIFAIDQEPGRLYKLTLDGKILGMLGESGRGPRQFNWPHGLACPSEDVVFVADMNNWRVQKLILTKQTAPGATQGGPIRVLASNGVRAALQDLIPQWERAIGRPLSVEFDPSAAIKRKIEANEQFDVTVLTSDVIDSLSKEGKLAAHARSGIGRIGVGVGVLAGAARPDIHTADTIKQALLNAKSMTWGEEGASRPAIDRMVAELGIADQLKTRVSFTKNVDQSMELVRAGKADLVITLISEILPAKGIQFVGPLPAKFQDYVTFATGINAASQNMDAAQAAVRFITGPTVAPAFKAKGIEPYALPQKAQK